MSNEQPLVVPAKTAVMTSPDKSKYKDYAKRNYVSRTVMPMETDGGDALQAVSKPDLKARIEISGNEPTRVLGRSGNELLRRELVPACKWFLPFSTKLSIFLSVHSSPQAQWRDDCFLFLPSRSVELQDCRR